MSHFLSSALNIDQPGFSNMLSRELNWKFMMMCWVLIHPNIFSNTNQRALGAYYYPHLQKMWVFSFRARSYSCFNLFPKKWALLGGHLLPKYAVIEQF